MEAIAKKTNKQNKSRAVAHNVSQQKSDGQGALEFVDNRTETRKQKNLQQIIHNSSKKLPALDNSSKNLSIQAKRDYRNTPMDNALNERWQPARSTALMYCDSHVSDWIDVAVKLGMTPMTRQEFGHGSKKSTQGSKKANSAYKRLRDNVRAAAGVNSKYRVSQL